MKMYFEWAGMDHDDLVRLLRWLVLVTKSLEVPSNPSKNCIGPSYHQMKDQVAQSQTPKDQ